MATVTKSPSYLVRNTYSYCFRMNVPKDLQPYVGKKELRYNLKTGCFGEAKLKAHLMAGTVDLLLPAKWQGRFRDLSDTEIQELVTQYLKKFVIVNRNLTLLLKD